MTKKTDDFDLVNRPEPENWSAGQGGDPEPSGRNWTWLITLGVIAFLAFAGGAALVTLRDRMGSEATPTAVASVITPTRESPEWVQTIVAISTQTAQPANGSPTPALVVTTPTPRGSATPVPTATPSPTPRACEIAVAAPFAGAFRRDVFGCALRAASTIWAAWEPFERGSMIWRSDTNRSYIFTLGGVWQVIDVSWDGQSNPGRGDPPAGLMAPQRGFGWAWATRDEIFNALGWATSEEKGFCADVQEFEQGFLLVSNSTVSCTAENLYNHASAGEWRPTLIAAHETGVWSGSLGGGAVVAPAPTRVVMVTARPDAHGIFAARPSAITVDGNLGDWPASGWQAIDTPVEGSQSYGGPSDAYATFQTAWSAQGLALAVQVTDDLFRPGPVGTDLWQGDALELHLDANLEQDYADTLANDDDYQLGIAVTDDGQTLQVYRWLPLAREGSLAAYGAGRAGDGVYIVEVLLPWDYFGMGAPAAASAYGFNLSISDNDSDLPAQETVLSASPVRTTYNNPTEWGTLVLAP